MRRLILWGLIAAGPGSIVAVEGSQRDSALLTPQQRPCGRDSILGEPSVESLFSQKAVPPPAPLHEQAVLERLSDLRSEPFYEFSYRRASFMPRPTTGLKFGDIMLNAFTFSWGYQTLGKRDWERFFGSPRYGLSFTYTRNEETSYGESVSLIPFIEGPFFRAGRFSTVYRMGFGLSWNKKIYDPLTNPNNQFIHTHLTADIDLNILLDYQLTRQFDIFGGVSFIHNSNGGLHIPNGGSNALGMIAGLRYIPNRKLYQTRLHYQPPERSGEENNSVFLLMAPGKRQSFYRGVAHDFFCLTLEAGYLRRFHPYMRYGAGLDFFYSDFQRYHLKGPDASLWLNYSQGVCGIFELMYGDFSLRFALGYYLYYPQKHKRNIYERAGVFYNFGHEFRQFAGVSIKALGGSADYIEWTYGCSIFGF